MSLTQGQTLFASVHEGGLADILNAFFTARPRYLNFGSPAFVPATTVSATSVAAIPFPGAPGGIEFAIGFTIPKVDIHPDGSGGTWTLTPGPGQLALKTEVTIQVLCTQRRRGEDEPRQTRIRSSLELYALCRPVVLSPVPGVGEIGIQVDQVELVDIKPDEIESIVECLLLTILRAVLSQVRIPFNTFAAGAFGFILLAGPLAEEDQVKVRGNAL
jgi:hypothetical protein